MSATYPVRKAAPIRKAAAKPRPRLVVIATPRRVVARGPFITIVGLLMLGGLLSLLMLHTLAAQDAFRQTSLHQRLSQLTDTQQQLEQQVQADSSPDALQKRAKALGMVPSAITSYHQRADGRTVAHLVAGTLAVTTTDRTTSTTATDDKTAAGDASTSDPAKSDAAKSATGSTSRHLHKKASQQ